MKTKTIRIIAGLTLAFSPLLFTGCGSVSAQQGIAFGTAEVGNAIATSELNRDPTTLKGLNDLAAELPKMATGGVTPFQFGALQAELQTAQENANTTKLKDQLTSLIALVSQEAAAASGGTVTIDQALAGGALSNVAQGINVGIQTWQGKQSVQHPAPVGT